MAKGTIKVLINIGEANPIYPVFSTGGDEYGDVYVEVTLARRKKWLKTQADYKKMQTEMEDFVNLYEPGIVDSVRVKKYPNKD